jgi:septum formation protein
VALSKNHIYLASRSPRRAELLKQIGIGFDFLLLREAPPRKPDVDETRLAGESAPDYVWRIAKIKAETGYERALQRGLAQFPVLAADTTVAVDRNVLGKPRNLIEAEEMLRMLSGRSHQVFTAVAIAFQKGGAASVRLSGSNVEFRKLEESEIRSYVASAEADDKAGAYAVQGKAAIFMSAISGSYSGIMGLPLYETAQLLEETGIVLFP